jgi:hypothetical protein
LVALVLGFPQLVLILQLQVIPQ